jgi:branched-chain amino acid transport system ATP-binding protein
MAEPLLRVAGLTKVFGGLRAVGDLSFGVDRHEIVGLIGPNGAGKTTVFNLLTGLYRPTAGHMVFDGRGLAGLPPHRIAALGIARTFQNLRLFTSMSVLDNVLVGMHLSIAPRVVEVLATAPAARAREEAARARAATLIAEMGLPEPEAPVASLPYGQQRLVELARALATRPRLLLLDEPSAGMNPNETDQLVGIIRRLRGEGLTILLIEHHMRMVMATCDRIIVLNQGEKIAEGPPEAVQRDIRVVEAYLGEEEG